VGTVAVSIYEANRAELVNCYLRGYSVEPEWNTRIASFDFGAEQSSVTHKLLNGGVLGNLRCKIVF
jgi:hypothetical protein